jgi:hypothetical protein
MYIYYYSFSQDGAQEDESSVKMSAAGDGDKLDQEFELLVGHRSDLTTIGLSSVIKGAEDVFSVWGIAGAGKSFLVKFLYSLNIYERDELR